MYLFSVAHSKPVRNKGSTVNACLRGCGRSTTTVLNQSRGRFQLPTGCPIRHAQGVLRGLWRHTNCTPVTASIKAAGAAMSPSAACALAGGVIVLIIVLVWRVLPARLLPFMTHGSVFPNNTAGSRQRPLRVAVVLGSGLCGEFLDELLRDAHMMRWSGSWVL